MRDVMDQDGTKDTTNPAYAALARKRRIELRNLQRANSSMDDCPECDGEDHDDNDNMNNRNSDNTVPTKKRVCRRKVESDDDDDDDDASQHVLIDPITFKPKPSITGIKKQSRYDPGVPMTREELKAWRKEARRVRNRESAAASRIRNRERISELTLENEELKSKYSTALKRIVELEAAVAAREHHHSCFTPLSLGRQDVALVSNDDTVSPITVPQHYGDVVNSSNTPFPIPSMDETSIQSCAVAERTHQEKVHKKYQHIMEMISRPIAVKTTGADTTTSTYDLDGPPPSSPRSACSDASSKQTAEAYAVSLASSESDRSSDIDESELGEFLLDALEGYDSMLSTTMELDTSTTTSTTN